MGAASSVPASGTAPYMGRSEAEIVNLMMPVFYVRDEVVTNDDLAIAKASWQAVLDDTAAGFLNRKGTPGFEHPSCIMFFYDCFYSRLFDVHPLSRPMFKSGLRSQGKFLVKMISLALSLINDETKFHETLVKLTETHNQRGVKAVEYGIVGEVLFWTLRQCMGRDYTAAVHTVWVKIVSRMLKVMVPVAVSFEINTGGVNQRERISQISGGPSGVSRASSAGHDSGAGADDAMEKKYL